jgi:hypothetical protein
MRKLLENRRREKWLVEHILTMKKTNASVNEFVFIQRSFMNMVWIFYIAKKNRSNM